MNTTKVCNSTDKFCGSGSPTKSSQLSFGFLSLEILLITIGTYILSVYLHKKVPVFKFVLEVIISHVIFLFAYPFIGIVVLVNSTVRFLLSCYLKLRYGNDVKLLPGLDSYWVPDSPGCPTIIEQFHVMKGDCKLDRIRQIFHYGIHVEDGVEKNHYDKLKFKLVTIFGYYCQEMDKNFDICNHIRYIFPDAHKRLITEDEVTKELQRLNKSPFTNDKAPWEILVIPKFDYKDPGKEEGCSYYATLYRINHGWIDGLSFVNLMDKMICDKRQPMIVDPRAPLKTTFLQSFLLYTKMFILGPRTILSSAVIKDDHCFHGPQIKGDWVYVRTKPFDFDVIKQIKEKTNSTIMSIFLTVIAGGMKNLAKMKHLPIPKSLHAGITCVMLPYEYNGPQNRFSIALVPLSVGKNETDKILEYTTASVKTFSKSIDPVLNFYGIGVIGSFPAKVIEAITKKFNATVVLTNLPSTNFRWEFYGDQVVGFTGWNLIKERTGLGVLISTYARKIQFSLVGDIANFTDEEDIPNLAVEMEREMQKLAVHIGIPEEKVFFTEF